MNKPLLVLAAAIVVASLPGPARADLAFNVGAVSDYRYRGVSQSRLEPAVQGGVDWSPGGLYLGAWASTIKWTKDAGRIGGFDAGNARVEIDLYGGYKGDVVKDLLSYDVGFLTYRYPGNKLGPRAETYEIYGASSYGPVTAKYSHSVSNLFGFAHSKASGYIEASASLELAPGLGVVPHVGHQTVAHNGNFSYTDYSLTLNYEAARGLVLGATAYATDTKKIGGAYAYASPAGKNLGRAGLVVGAKYNF